MADKHMTPWLEHDRLINSTLLNTFCIPEAELLNTEAVLKVTRKKQTTNTTAIYNQRAEKDKNQTALYVMG